MKQNRRARNRPVYRTNFFFAKAVQQKKYNFLANGTGIIGYPFAKRNFSSYLIPYTKIYSKRIIELNENLKILNFKKKHL